jgi:hypothetical protein
MYLIMSKEKFGGMMGAPSWESTLSSGKNFLAFDPPKGLERFPNWPAAVHSRCRQFFPCGSTSKA